MSNEKITPQYLDLESPDQKKIEDSLLLCHQNLLNILDGNNDIRDKYELGIVESIKDADNVTTCYSVKTALTTLNNGTHVAYLESTIKTTGEISHKFRSKFNTNDD